MTFAKPKSQKKDEPEYSIYCSVDGCGRQWAVRQDGDKQKCSYHQWQFSGKNRENLHKPVEKVKTISQWYHDKDDEMEF